MFSMDATQGFHQTLKGINDRLPAPQFLTITAFKQAWSQISM